MRIRGHVGGVVVVNECAIQDREVENEGAQKEYERDHERRAQAIGGWVVYRIGSRLGSRHCARLWTTQGLGIWRRGWDLNPRYPLRYVRFRGGSFQPLTHLSARSQLAEVASTLSLANALG